MALISSGVPLLDLALIEYGDAVGQLHRLVLIMGHENSGQAGGFVDVPQPDAQFFTHLGIQRAERLVEQEHLRFDGESASATRCLCPPESCAG